MEEQNDKTEKKEEDVEKQRQGLRNMEKQRMNWYRPMVE